MKRTTLSHTIGGMVRSRLMRVASALAAIAVVCCISPPGVEADALPPGYPAYIPVDQYYASQGLGLISATVVFNEVFTGTDNNGGYVEQETTWGTVYSEPSPFSINDGGYTANGYVNAGLRFPIQPENAVLTNAPPASNQPFKDPTLINNANTWSTYTGNLGTIIGLAGFAGACGSGVAICEGVAAGLGLASLTLFGISIDPIDSNYTVIATPIEGTVEVPNLPVWGDLVSAVNDLSGVSTAIQDSFNRADGAFAAGAPQFWVDLQVYAGEQYDQLAAADMARIEADADSLGLLTNSPVGVPEPGTLALLNTAVLALLLIRSLHIVFLARPGAAVKAG